MKDVAGKAGVSLATVSKALNDKPDISQPMRERIFRICEELGYQVNFRIQDMILERQKGQTGNLAFIMGGLEFGNPPYSRMLDGIAAGVSSNFRLILEVLSGEEGHVYDLPASLRDGRVDGVVITGNINEGIIGLLEKLDLPYVILGNYSPLLTQRAVGSIDFDIKTAFYRIIYELKKLGRRKIALFTENPVSYYSKTAFQSYCESLEEHGLTNENLLYAGDGPYSGAFHLLKSEFRKRNLPFDSMITINLRTAGEISNLIMGHFGLKRTVDFHLALLRPYDYYQMVVPSVYCNVPIFEMSRSAVELLIDFLNGKRLEKGVKRQFTPTIDVSTI